MTRCVVCHRPLTDLVSIRLRIGPDCRGRMVKRGWRFPIPRWKAQGGQVTLIGLRGRIEPPVGDVSKETERIIKALTRKTEEV